MCMQAGRQAARKCMGSKKRTSFSDKLYNEDVELTHLTGSQQYLYSISPLVNVDMAYFVETISSSSSPFRLLFISLVSWFCYFAAAAAAAVSF